MAWYRTKEFVPCHLVLRLSSCCCSWRLFFASFYLEQISTINAVTQTRVLEASPAMWLVDCLLQHWSSRTISNLGLPNQINLFGCSFAAGSLRKEQNRRFSPSHCVVPTSQAQFMFPLPRPFVLCVRWAGAASFDTTLRQQFDALTNLLEDTHPRVRAVAAKVRAEFSWKFRYFFRDWSDGENGEDLLARNCCFRGSPDTSV